MAKCVPQYDGVEHEPIPIAGQKARTAEEQSGIAE